jgi:transcriptional regulator CtsR
MNKNTSDTIESLERQLIATQAEVDSLRESIAQLFQLVGALEVKDTE